ncbi:MAG TPA: NHL repeat-containing protein [Solirubrobacterales bacterium]|nr:NHL repeat-containing protein [Solirubrobacterales bacterium]
MRARTAIGERSAGRGAFRLVGALCAGLASLALIVPAAQGATEPIFVFTPAPPPPSAPPKPIVPPPTGYLYGPCGLAVDSSGRIYVADYYHHAIDVFSSAPGYQGQLANEDPEDGPCGLALNSTNQLYVNNLHKDVVKFNAYPAFGAATVFPLPTEDTEHHLPTGVAVDPSSNRVYVNHRTYVSAFDSAGNPVLDGGEPLKIGLGSLGDGYGLAVSGFPATLGRVYVPDAASRTVKVYDPLVSKTTPVAEIKDPFNKPFVSLRDSAVAVDRVTGEVYFADDLQPTYTERPQALIYVYGPTNLYKGHLKYNVITARPVGIAVDNTISSATQGRVYVTSGNTTAASIYAYGPGSATTATPLPPLGSGLPAPGGSSASGVAGAAASSAAMNLQPAQSRSAGPASAAASVITQEGSLRVAVNANLSPKRLPRDGAAPIAVAVGWQIATTDGSPPPRLKGLSIQINRHGRFERAGLPTCAYAKIQPATTQRALANCRAALVGRGSFSAEIALKGQEGESYEARGQLLVFNGEVKGKPVLFGQIYSPRPFATSFVIPFEVAELGKGAYGTVLSATLPKTLRSWGNLTGIEMRLSRKYGFKGKRRSYISAGCPAPKGVGLASFKLARTEFAFNGGKELASTVVGDCRVRG